MDVDSIGSRQATRAYVAEPMQLDSRIIIGACAYLQSQKPAEDLHRNETLKFRIAKVQKFRRAYIQKLREGEIQKCNQSIVQKFRNSENQKFRNSAIQNFRNSEPQNSRILQIQKRRNLACVHFTSSSIQLTQRH